MNLGKDGNRGLPETFLLSFQTSRALFVVANIRTSILRFFISPKRSISLASRHAKALLEGMGSSLLFHQGQWFRHWLVQTPPCFD